MNKHVRTLLLPVGWTAFGLTLLLVGMATFVSGIAVAIIEDGKKS